MGITVPEQGSAPQKFVSSDQSTWPTLDEWDAATGYSEDRTEPEPWERLAKARVQALEARSLTPERAARDAALAGKYQTPVEQVAVNRSAFEER